MLGQLHRAGFPVAARVEDASLVVINTCAFLTASQAESIETILEVARLKKRGRLRKLVVSGCLAQRHGASVLDEIPEIDYLLGPGTIDQVGDVAAGLLRGDLERGARLGGLERSGFEWEPRVLSGFRHTAYLKISEGCNNTCSFCVIPQLRGKHRSRPLEQVVAEARRLGAAGVKELTVIAQDTTSYGIDLYGRFSLDRLLEALDAVPGVEWIRLLYTYPRYWTEGLLESFSRLEHLCPYVDIPIQHAADRILHRMRRGAGWPETEALLRRIREAAPEMTVRTTVITGFPGETEEEFRFLLNFLREFEFDQLGAFAYSTEDGTGAGAMEDQLPEEVREERRHQVLRQQQAISLRRNRARVGRTLQVLIDDVDSGKGLARGRWAGQALEIDGQVLLRTPGRNGGRALEAGELVPAIVQGTGPYDLIGRLDGTGPGNGGECG